ncbi:MAG: hypothetical protein HC904_08840 [Blastochloris sp.]|nr:hypothetical protein [Blastochloris sp.]
MTPQKDDFPDWLSPALVKELRQGIRTRAFVATFLLLQTLLALMVMLVALSHEATPDSNTLQTINGFFWFLVCTQLLFVMPCRALGALSSEIKANTLELMTLSELSAWRIVCGKWISLTCQSLLLVVSVLPYAVIRYFLAV